MKRTLILALILAALVLSSCGSKAETVPDMQTLYDSMRSNDAMKEMLIVPGDKAEYVFGVLAADCRQEILSVSQDSVLADEVWLIEAADQSAADRIEKLAAARMEQKGNELKSYAPDQYQIVQKGVLLRRGNCVYLIISPAVDELTKLIP